MPKFSKACASLKTRSWPSFVLSGHFCYSVEFFSIGTHERAMILQRPLLAFSLHFIHLGATNYKEGAMFNYKGSRMPLLLGLLLLTITGCSSALRSSSSEHKTTASVPEPSILHDKVAVIPSLDARLTKLAFFSTNDANIEPLQNTIHKS